MAGGFGSARDDYMALSNNLKLTGVVNGCADLIRRIARDGLGPWTASEALAALDRLAEAADYDLRRGDELRDRRMERIKGLVSQSAAAAESACDEKCAAAEAALSRDRAEAEQEARRLETSIETEKGALELAGKLGDTRQQARAQERMDYLLSAKAALGQDVAAAMRRCEDRKRAAGNERTSQLAEAGKAEHAAREECQRLHDAYEAYVAHVCDVPVAGLVPRAAYEAALQVERDMRLDLRNPTMRDVAGYSRPPHFLLGSVYVPAALKTAYGGRTVFDRVLPEAVCSSPAGERAVCLPLVCDLAEGLRLVLKMVDEEAIRMVLRSLTMRLLLAYPPTTLNVALFDPLRNGETFAGLRSIVDLPHENILPDVVVSARELTARLQSLRLRMAQHIGNYGDPLRDGFFAHQAVQAIVVNDFPYGFDEASLSELAKICQSGARLGTIVIVSVNANYVGKLHDNADFKSIVDDGRAMVLSGSGNWLERTGTRLYVRIGEVEEVCAAEGRVLDTLKEKIAESKGRIYSFDEMTGEKGDASSWLHESSIGGVGIPIGLTGGNQLARVTVGQPGGSVHHGLIGGTTGGGKSSLFHTMITSVLRCYPASEVQLVLIDFKEGDEFAPFAHWNIPSLRSVTVTTKPELALAALEDVSSEWDYRASLRMSDYDDWRREHPDEFMPRIIVIFDEVQEILSDFSTPPEIRDRCLAIIAHLTRQGRSHGIHLFLASQSFGKLAPIMELADNMQCRIALKPGTDLLKSDEALVNAQAGAAIFNEHGGSTSEGNQLVQVALLDKDDEDSTLGRLEAIYADPSVRATLPEEVTRVYYSSLGDNPRHPFNLLLAGSLPRRHEDSCPIVTPGLILSEPGVEDAYALTGEPCDVPLARNLLLVSPDAGAASRVLVNMALSLGIDDLGRQSGGLYGSDRVVLVTFEPRRSRVRAARREDARGIELKDLDVLPYVERVSGTVVDFNAGAERTPFERAVDEIHETLLRRKEQGFDGRGCYVLVICNLAAASGALGVDLQALGGALSPTLLEKVQDIILDGPVHGIQTIVWTSAASDVEGVLGHGGRAVGLRQFGARLVFGRDGDELRALTGVSAPPATPGALTLLDGSDGSRLYVAPIDLPRAQSREWLGSFASACERAREARSAQGPSPW